jgi:hypothetical protein
VEALEGRWVPDGGGGEPIPPPAIIVTTAADVSDPFDEWFSLREAINWVNAYGDPQVQQRITFAANLAGETFWLDDELPGINNYVWLDGLGQSQVIRRDETKGNFRLLRVMPTGTLRIEHLSLWDGYTDFNMGGGIGGGGAIYARGDLIARDCTFANNSVSSALGDGAGGAIWASGKYTAQDEAIGSLVIENCTFYCNTAPWGGAVKIDRGVRTINVSNSEFSYNAADQSGGALYMVGQITPNMAVVVVGTISHCTIDNNAAGLGGGGIYAEALNLHLRDQTVISNNSAVRGGGVYMAGVVDNNVVFGFLYYAGVSIGGNTASDAGTGVYRKTAGAQIVAGTSGVQWFGNPANSETFVP